VFERFIMFDVSVSLKLSKYNACKEDVKSCPDFQMHVSAVVIRSASERGGLRASISAYLEAAFMGLFGFL
jgi:hypothetical protein